MSEIRKIQIVPASVMNSIIKPWPFRGWAMDMIGQINPPSSKGHQWVLAVTDYFIKCVEAVPMRSVASKDVISFVKEHIIHRFGIPQTWRIKTIQWSTSVKSGGAGRRLEMWHIEWLRWCRSSFGGARAEAGHMAKAGGIGGFPPKPPQDLVSRYGQKPRAKASRRRTRGGINAIEILFAHLLSPFLCFVFEVLAFN